MTSPSSGVSRQIVQGPAAMSAACNCPIKDCLTPLSLHLRSVERLEAFFPIFRETTKEHKMRMGVIVEVKPDLEIDVLLSRCCIWLGTAPGK
jgi:hypothetical protein